MYPTPNPLPASGEGETSILVWAQCAHTSIITKLALSLAGRGGRG